ncbi:MAG: 4-hydroxy-4-methyl-2-oxoglutarate aldolase [Pseudomonadota bacterium]|nr:4-hydroxy-4-methyl-2-oxoglutarate aldolase [Pseudomonadota bacterium]
MADFKRPDAALLAEAAKFPTATMHEAGGKIGALPSAIKPTSPEFEVCGPAYPVSGPAGDNLWLHRAIANAEAGDVLVAYLEDHYEAGYWGEIMSTAAKARDLGGLVIDACVRDGAILPEVGFPVFARGLCIRGTGKDFAGKGSLGTPLAIGNILVEPGDLVRGDTDGVVIVPQARIAEVNEKSQERESKEAAVMERLRGGETSLEIYGWD